LEEKLFWSYFLETCDQGIVSKTSSILGGFK
jgi:hypothetical protein